jgi:predicted NUDIX family NTP pyrophosphohydrolase
VLVAGFGHTAAMPPHSAGLLLFRLADDRPKVFLVHPGGPFYSGRRQGVWSLPKGLVEDGEDERAAALREFREETGSHARGDLLPLGEVRYSRGKTVVAWAVEHRGDGEPFVDSITFEMEWPPRSGQMRQFPEADEGRFFTVEEARAAILPAQLPFIDRLVALLAHRSGSG